MTSPNHDEGYGLYDRPVTLAANQHLNLETNPCDVCRGTSAHPRFDVAGLTSQIVECNQCGTARFFPPIPVSQIASFYPTEYYGSTGEKFRPSVEFLVRILAARQARFITRQIPAGGRVLDVGCGRGTLLDTLARQGYEAHGFELSADAAKGLNPKIELRTGPDLRAANYPERWFDAVVIWHVLEHLPEPRAVIEEAHRILKPGGLLVVAVPNYSSWQSRWAECDWFHLDLPRHLFHFPVAGLKQLTESCGFERQTSHHFSLRQNPFGWVQSALNKWHWGRRNGLYVMLHGTPSGMSHPTSLAQRCLWNLAFVLGMPIGLGLSILEAAYRQGGTVHIVARRRSNPE